MDRQNNSDYNNSINNSDDINPDDWVIEYQAPYQVKNNAPTAQIVNYDGSMIIGAQVKSHPPTTKAVS